MNTKCCWAQAQYITKVLVNRIVDPLDVQNEEIWCLRCAILTRIYLTRYISLSIFQRLSTLIEIQKYSQTPKKLSIGPKFLFILSAGRNFWHICPGRGGRPVTAARLRQSSIFFLHVKCEVKYDTDSRCHNFRRRMYKTKDKGTALSSTRYQQ